MESVTKGVIFMEKTNKKKKPMSREKSKKLLESMIMTAIFTAMAVVLKSITKVTIPIMGSGGLVINFAGIFSFFPAILYGPLYGGASSALCDILGWVINPSGGAYNPAFTIVAFLGGAAKGVMWMVFTKKLINKNVIKTVLLCLFVVFLAFGTVFTVSLNNDGIISGVISNKTDLIFKHEMENTELSPFSNIAVSLARYNKDTITLTYAKPDEEGVCMLPSSVFVGDYEYKITKLDAAVLNNADIKKIIIPADYTAFTYSKDFVLTNKEIQIYALKPSDDLAKFCANQELTINEVNYDRVATNVSEYGTKFENASFKFKSSDTYRKYLSGYMNFMTIGFILSGALGLLIMLIAFILGKTGVLKSSEKTNLYLRVLTTVLVSGLIVTTINTFVLLATMATYSGRLFWIVYLPRFAEEIFVSIVQAYAITILFTALSANKSFSNMLGLDVAKSKNTEKTHKA
jgi:ECF transporter S component (folate family)